jgi:predicted ATPase/class 3 adenylate cyclase
LAPSSRRGDGASLERCHEWESYCSLIETVVLLFTDVEGSTRGWAAGPGMLRNLGRHDELLRAAIGRHAGVEFKHTGDGLCVTFPTVSAAVAAAIDAQRALSAADWSEGSALKVRMAVHVGSAHRRGDDWFGLSLSRCARLMDAAHGGQVVVSGAAAALLCESPIDEVGLMDLGRVELRDLAGPEHVWQVTAPGLAMEFPALRHGVLTAGNLPVEVSTLIGRAAEIDHVGADLAEARLVVLTGPGGVGKTRLAVAAAAAVSAAYSAGVWLVELAASGDPGDVDPLVATALGFAPRAGLSARASIIEGIGDRELLLVLDNCEHVLDAAADFAHETLRRCPRLRILATSREPLDVDGERVVRVPSLSVDSDAVELFVDRARNADPSFRADPRASVEQICQRLGGIPLAIELAAARVRTLRLPELAARLDEHLDVLPAGRHGRVRRHQTLRAALNWSWGLLDDDERTAFGRLSVFAGGFDMAAANAVAAGTPLGDDVVDVVSALVDKSMVVANLADPAPFRLLEPLRQYGAERLAALGDPADLARRHARYYAGLGGRLADALFGPDELEVAARLGAARDNLRAAFAFAVASEDGDLALRIVAPLSRYTSLYVWAEPWSWCRVALDLPGADVHPLRALTLTCASRGAWQVGDQTGALALADQALSLADPGTTTWCEAQSARANALGFLGRLDDADAAATAAVELGGDDGDGRVLQRVAIMMLYRYLAGRPEPAATRQLLERASTSSPTTYALALWVAAQILQDEDRAAAIEWNEHAVELAAASGAVLTQGVALVTRASFEATVDAATAARSYVVAMARFLRVGSRAHVRVYGRAVISPLVACGAHQAAATVDGATRHEHVHDVHLKTQLDDAIAQARAELGPSYDTAATRGEKLTDDELVHYLQRVVADL